MTTTLIFAAALLTAIGLLAAPNLHFAGMAWLVLSPLLYPFARYPQSGALLTFDRVCVGALALALLMSKVRRPPRAPSVRAFAIAGVVFAGLFLARCLTTSPGALSALQTFIDAVLLPCVVFAVCRSTAGTHRRLRAWAAGLMVCGTIVALLGITERLFAYELASRSGGSARVDHEIGGIVRVSGPYSVPEVYALVLALTLAATLFWWMSGRVRGNQRRGLVDLVGPVLAAVQITGMAISLFRVAWACALLILVVGLGLRSRRRIRLAVAGVVVAFGAVILLMPLQSSDVFRERVGNTDNVAGRLATHKVGIEIWRSAPVTGVGIHQFIVAQRQSGQQQVWGVRSVESPHSSFLGTLAEQGIVGFTALIAMCACAVRMLRRLGEMSRGDPVLEALRAAVLAGASAYLLFSVELTMLPLGPSNAVLAVLLGLAAAAIENGRARTGPEKRTVAAEHGAVGGMPAEAVH
ncbi:O-antigen ligase family protein [Streptomyces sp. NBC_00390]|uniref:O-antigen ligase family protein n=1 Tax=Streptomyces sp. NBC_00390 TaxID=2975736 RepID=UPI002E1A4AFD